MKKRIIHYCLVSEQPSPNISPLFDERLKPDEVVLIISPQQKNFGAADALINTIKPIGITVHELLISDAWDKENIQQQLLSDLNERNDETIEFYLNSTGGTKPMSIAAYEIFYNESLPVFYIHDDKVCWLYNAGKDLYDFDLVDKLKLPTFLKAHGVAIEKIESNSVPIAWQSIGNNWIDRVKSQSQALATLNYIASNSKNSLDYSLTVPELKNDYLQILIGELEEAEILKREGQNITFSSEQARFFANGGWLECWILKELNSLKKQHPIIQDVQMGVTVNYREGNDKTRIKNELDVVVLANNRLYLVECKTGQMQVGGSGNASSKATDTVYKLATVMRSVGGIMAKGIITSYNQVSDFDKERAAMLNIKVCDGVSIKNIKSTFLEMING